MAALGIKKEPTLPNSHTLTLTQNRILAALILRLRSQNKNTFSIMVIGKTGVGKSSTINSLCNHNRVSTVGALTSNATDAVTTFVRTLWGLKLTLIDTPGLNEKDRISRNSIEKIKNYVLHMEKNLDVVMYCERADLYRFEPIDEKVIYTVTKVFGESIWQRTMHVFTRAGSISIPSGQTYDQFIGKRAEMFSKYVKKFCRSCALPVSLVENLVTRNLIEEIPPSHVETNKIDEKWKTVRDTTVTKNATALLLLSSSLNFADDLTASSMPTFHYNPKEEKRRDPNERRKWLIPLLFLIQLYRARFKSKTI